MEKSLISLSGFVEVADLKGKDVINLLSSNWKDYEDSTQHASAMHIGANCIVTRNKKDFQQSQLPVFTIPELKQRLNL